MQDGVRMGRDEAGGARWGGLGVGQGGLQGGAGWGGAAPGAEVGHEREGKEARWLG